MIMENHIKKRVIIKADINKNIKENNNNDRREQIHLRVWKFKKKCLRRFINYFCIY